MTFGETPYEKRINKLALVMSKERKEELMFETLNAIEDLLHENHNRICAMESTLSLLTNILDTYQNRLLAILPSIETPTV